MNLHYHIYKYVNKLKLHRLMEDFLIGAIEITGLLLITYIFDFILKKIIINILSQINKKIKGKWINALYNNRVFNTLVHIISTSTTYYISTELLFFKYSIVYHIIKTIFSILGFIIFIQLINRIISTIIEVSSLTKDYRTVAIRSMGQMTQILLYVLAGIYVISVITNQDLKVIIGALSALTAVIILIFKDIILGFITGIQLANSKAIKIGDWIAVPKSEVDGEVIEINLVSAKIRNFDKTISTIPTYDLISSTVKSYEEIRKVNTRRIKRSIFFNIKSFKFLEDNDIKRLEQYTILENYLANKRTELEIDPTTNHFSKNKIRLTNIGTFRTYIKLYLENNPEIDQESQIIVRQLDPSPYGLPLEIYCFTNEFNWNSFEQIQNDIFDHILTISKEFDLEIMQVAAK